MFISIIDGFERYIRTELCLSQETLSAYTRDVKEFFDFIGTKKLSAQLIETFITHLRKREIEPTTIRRKCMSIRCLCYHLISLDLIDSNIPGMIDSIRVERKVFDVLDSQDVDALVATMEKRVSLLRTTNIRRNVAIILTLYHSGLRVSELCSLDLSNINFAKKEIRVKGKGSCERMVPTTQECVEAIQKYINLERQSSMDAVFVKSDGGRITRRAISDMLISLSHRAGVKHTTAHMLRRSCATSLMNNGVDLELVQSLLGHKYLSTTQAYLVVNPDQIAEVHKCCHPFGEKHGVS